jgi:hypothetical protein
VQKTVKWLVVAALSGAIIFIIGSCQKGSATVNPQEVRISFNDKEGQWEIATLEVARGGQIAYFAEDQTIWMLFPGDLNYIEGKGSFCKTKNLLAVMIERDGYAIIEVPEYFPNPDVVQTISYSVMQMRDGGEKPGDWQYVHGKNPPPRMIIPPRR